MMVMVSNNSGREARSLAATFPGHIGHLYAPDGWRGPWAEFPHALDNGAFKAFRRGVPFDADAFSRLCDRAALAEQRTGLAPAWVAVPDVVCNAAATLAWWDVWAPMLRGYGWPLAFVAQNGHTPADVPREAALVFIGGDKPWKRANAPVFAAHHRVHVGRVTTAPGLAYYAAAGAESVDGTGWFRGDRVQLDRLWYWLADRTGRVDCPVNGPMQPRLFGGEWAA